MYVVKLNKANHAPNMFKWESRVINFSKVQWIYSTAAYFTAYFIQKHRVCNRQWAWNKSDFAIGRYMAALASTCPHPPLPERSPLQWLQLHPVRSSNDEWNKHSIGEILRLMDKIDQNPANSGILQAFQLISLDFHHSPSTIGDTYNLIVHFHHLSVSRNSPKVNHATCHPSNWFVAHLDLDTLQQLCGPCPGSTVQTLQPIW